MIRTRTRLVMTLLLLSTFAVANEEETNDNRAQLTLDDMRTFTDVFNQIRTNYDEEYDDRTLLNAALRVMLSELDPHSA